MQQIIVLIILIIAIIVGNRLYHLIYGGTVYFGENAGGRRAASFIVCVFGVFMILVFIASKIGLVELPGSEEETSQQQVEEQSHNEDGNDLLNSSLLDDDYSNFDDNEYEYDEEEGDSEENDDEESMRGTAEEYIFYDSDSRFLTNAELERCDFNALRIARNEIYARRGRCFSDEELQEYFESTSWYEGTIAPEDFDESVFNKYEKKNLKKIKRFEGQ